MAICFRVETCRQGPPHYEFVYALGLKSTRMLEGSLMVQRLFVAWPTFIFRI